MPVVILKLPSVLIPCFPYVLASPIFLIVQIIAFVPVPIYHHPHPSSVSHSRQEFATVKCTAIPVVLAVPFGGSLLVLSDIQVPVSKYLQTFPLFFPFFVHLPNVNIPAIAFLHHH